MKKTIYIYLGTMLLIIPQTIAIMGGVVPKDDTFYGVVWTLVWFVGIVLLIKGISITNEKK